MYGHQREQEIFRNAITNGRLLHAYIFSGTEGIGKKLFALELAKGLMCREGKLFEPCSCPGCAQVASGTHPDFALLTDEDLKIANIRDITERAMMTPLSGPRKVFIIDNVHQLGADAANAFLKTLEEPGDNTHFFLITDRYDRLLPTIRSRCVRVEFGLLSDDDVRSVLKEQLGDDADIDIVAAAAGGAAGQALALFESGTAEFIRLVQEGSMAGVARFLNGVKTKQGGAAVISALYAELIALYRKNGDRDILDFAYYLLDILRRFDYNINFDMSKMDLLTKIIEVFGEKSAGNRGRVQAGR